LNDEFDKLESELVNSDKRHGIFGIRHGTRYHTSAGVSSLYSEVYFLDDVSEDDIQEIPDYVKSDNLQVDIESTVTVCLLELKHSKYLPSGAKIGSRFGALPKGDREGVYLTGWEDFDILGVYGQPLYTKDEVSLTIEADVFPLSIALERIVRDICDADEFLSERWYYARIAQEYFATYPLRLNSAYLIGELFKEVCMKQQFEGDLKSYYLSLGKAQAHRKKGTQRNQDKAEELRQYCVELFVKLAKKLGPRLQMAPFEHQARELRTEALKERPDDFNRAGLIAKNGFSSIL